MTKEQLEALDRATKELMGLSEEDFQKRLEEANASDFYHILNEMRPVGIFPQEVKMNEIKFNEVEINRVNLAPGDVLLLKVKGPDFENNEVCESLKESFKKIFPNNKIGVLFLQENSIEIDVISTELAERMEKASNEARQFAKDLIQKQKEEVKENNSCSPTNYCVDCNCGKKLAVEEQNLEIARMEGEQQANDMLKEE